MVARLRRVEATQAGAQFVDFEGVDDANKAVRLSDYVGKGHYVLVASGLHGAVPAVVRSVT